MNWGKDIRGKDIWKSIQGTWNVELTRDANRWGYLLSYKHKGNRETRFLPLSDTTLSAKNGSISKLFFPEKSDRRRMLRLDECERSTNERSGPL